MLGELHIDINRLSEKEIRRCRKLSEKNMIISGSILLKAYGLLSRETDDVDVLWDIEKYNKKEKIIRWWNKINSRAYPDIESKKSLDNHRYKVSYLFFMGRDFFTNVDIFQNDTTKFKEEFGIKWACPIRVIIKKKGFNRTKDWVDFKEIATNINFTDSVGKEEALPF